MDDSIDYDLELLRSSAMHNPDWFLQMWVKSANKSGESLSVTLLVHGALVSGDIIGGREYFEIFGSLLGKSSDMSEEAAKSLFDPIAETFYSQSDDDEATSDDPGPGFIHLKNVTVFQGSMLIPQNQDGLVWRGRLAEIDGWIPGRLEVNQS